VNSDQLGCDSKLKVNIFQILEVASSKTSTLH